LSATNDAGVKRYALPGVPTPILPADIANKAYVDVGGTKFAWGGGFRVSYSFNELNFFPFNNAENVTPTESDMAIPYSDAIRITAISVVIPTNTKNADTIIGVRDDGVTVALVTIGAGVTGIVRATGLSVDIAAGSELVGVRDTTASASGSIQHNTTVIEGIIF